MKIPQVAVCGGAGGGGDVPGRSFHNAMVFLFSLTTGLWAGGRPRSTAGVNCQLPGGTPGVQW